MAEACGWNLPGKARLFGSNSEARQVRAFSNAPHAISKAAKSKPGARAASAGTFITMVGFSIPPFFTGRCDLADKCRRDHQGAVAVGVNQVAGADREAEDGDGYVNLADMDEGVAGTD